MSLSTPSAAGPCQCGQVAGQRDLYLKDQQDIHTNGLMFEEPLPETLPTKLLLVYSRQRMPKQIKMDTDKRQTRVIFDAEGCLLTPPQLLSLGLDI